MNIVLIGFMASGKTNIGKSLAKKLKDYRFVDIDKLIVKEAGMSINNIFEKNGEPYFRKIETKMLKETAGMDNVIIATGGGAVLRSENMETLEENGMVVYLKVSADVVFDRVKNDTQRPLLKVKDPLSKIKELLEKRETYYQRNNYMIDSSSDSPDIIADKIIDLIPENIDVKLKKNSYKIFIGRKYLESIKWIDAKKHKKVLVITDEKIASLYYKPFEKKLIDNSFDVRVKILPQGEQEKNLDTIKNIYSECIDHSMDRSSLIIALGGGVVGDISGFAAATYLRGISFIQVPTTLLAQVDAGIGGKTGVDLPQGKNLVGSFYQPKFVWIDPLVLKTLDNREFKSGLAEVVKYGIIKNKKLFNYLEKNIDKIINKDEEALLYILNECAKIKAEVVSHDEREGNLRRILNFGHTLAHAIEAYEEYKGLKHGEAVSVGMSFAVYLGYRLGYCSESDVKKINSLLDKIGFDINNERIKFGKKDNYVNDIIKIMRRDKKAYIDKVKFILPKEIGEVLIVPIDLEKDFEKILYDWGCL